MWPLLPGKGAVTTEGAQWPVAGNAADLAAKVESARAHPEEMAAMGHAARAEYQAK